MLVGEFLVSTDPRLDLTKGSMWQTCFLWSRVSLLGLTEQIFCLFFHCGWAVPQRWQIPSTEFKPYSVSGHPKPQELYLNFGELGVFSFVLVWWLTSAQNSLIWANQFWVIIWLQSEMCYFPRTANGSDDTMQWGKGLPFVPLSLTLFLGLVLSLLLKDLFQTKGATLFNNLK